MSRNLIPIYIDKETGELILRDGSDSGNSGNAAGFQHIQATDADIWYINHNKNSEKVMIQIFDNTGEEIQPDSTTIMDVDLVIIRFGVPMSGKANLIFFN
jgi:hypothetical protein